jgi:hypothetical protein
VPNIHGKPQTDLSVEFCEPTISNVSLKPSEGEQDIIRIPVKIKNPGPRVTSSLALSIVEVVDSRGYIHDGT